MKSSIKQFKKELNETLKKCDVAELRTFVNAHKEYYSAATLRLINNGSDELLNVALHKMIVQEQKLPKALRDKSALWLITHGYDLKIIKRSK